MLKRMFALSDQGSKDLNKGIAATTLTCFKRSIIYC